MSLFKSSDSYTLNRTIFPNNYFYKNMDYFQDIKTKGYIIIRNAVLEKQLAMLEVTYQQLTQFPEFSLKDKFQNSGRFQAPEIRNFVMENIGQFSKEFLPLIFNPEVYDSNTTGAFQIKPSSKISELNPHQDAPVIDETKENGLFVWIPLCDITEKNGAVCVLPGSHLWGNHQRSLNVPWPFEKHIKLLWKFMQPIYLNKGDILVWDTALVHSSFPNLSNETRIAITTTILPKNFDMVEYFMDKKTPKGKIEKYKVERSFWESEDIMRRPPCPPNKFIELEDMVFDKITSNQLLELINRFQS